LIDLEKLDELEYDPITMIARVSPNHSGRTINKALRKYDAWFPGGHCPDVGVGGFLLQGGSGWNNRNYGLIFL